MNPRERTLAWILGGIVGAGALAVLAHYQIVVPHREASERLAAAQDDLSKREQDLQLFSLEKAEQTKWNKLSLPKNFEKATAQYGQMLRSLIRDAGLTIDDLQGPPPQEGKATGSVVQKKPQHAVLPFTVRAKGTLANLTLALDALQRVPVMHRIKSIVIDRVDPKDKTGKLAINLALEAVSVHGVDNEPKYAPKFGLLPPHQTAQLAALMSRSRAPAIPLQIPYVLPKTVLAKLDAPDTSPRNLGEMALRNPFVGLLPTPPPPPKPKVVVKQPVEPPVELGPTGPDPREYIKIEQINPPQEAFLRNYLFRASDIRIRSTPMSGYDTFRVWDEDRERVLVQAKVLRIDPRDVYFQVNDEAFGMHFGQTMAAAMARPLSEFELDRLDLKIDAAFAEAAKAETTKKAPAKTGSKTPTKKR